MGMRERAETALADADRQIDVQTSEGRHLALEIILNALFEPSNDALIAATSRLADPFEEKAVENYWKKMIRAIKAGA